MKPHWAILVGCILIWWAGHEMSGWQLTAEGKYDYGLVLTRVGWWLRGVGLGGQTFGYWLPLYRWWRNSSEQVGPT